MTEKVFGEKKEGLSYRTRIGAYLVAVYNGRAAVVRTPRGYFLLGGKIEEGETHPACIQRECLEESGYQVSVGAFIGSAETYCQHPTIGWFHPVQYYYVGRLEKQVQAPIETDHHLEWLPIEELQEKMVLKSQWWAIKKALSQLSGDRENNQSAANTVITQRDISQEELEEIYADFKAMERADGVCPQKETRYQFVAEENGKMIGLASGLVHHEWFYLSDLWVREGHRGKGLGSQLLVCLEEKVRSLGVKHIYTWTSGHKNPRFYERHQYRVFTVFENYYGIEDYPQIGYRKDL